MLATDPLGTPLAPCRNRKFYIYTDGPPTHTHTHTLTHTLGKQFSQLDLEQLQNYTWSIPFWDKTKWTLMELSDSMATKDQAIDAKDLDGLMEGVWAKGALGGLDDSQRLLDFYFFENH